MDFTDNQNLYIGISEKKDGLMNISTENRFLFFKNKSLDNKIIVSAGLAHKNKVVNISNLDKNGVIPNCDALITNQSKYLLTISIADCLPIYFYDKNKKVVALAHAGWRGVVSKIAKEVITQFLNHYNSNLSDIEVFIGPYIKDCHFEVKSDVANQFKSSDTIIRNEKIYINLSQVINLQLIEMGIFDNNINISPECTYCLTEKYFSYRRDNLKEFKMMVAYIGLK